MLRISIKQNINIIFKKCESSDSKRLEDPNSLIEYSNNMHDVFKNIEQ